MLAFDAEHERWNGLPLSAKTPIGPSEIEHRTGRSTYRTLVSEHLATVGDLTTLYALVLVHSCALTEAHAWARLQARVMEDATLEQRLATHLGYGAKPRPFDEMVGSLMHVSGVEAWAGYILTEVGESWNHIFGGKALVVEAFTVRNAIAHGQTTATQSMANRVTNVGGTLPWAPGDEIALDFDRVQRYRRSLLELCRVISVKKVRKPKAPKVRPRKARKTRRERLRLKAGL